MVSAVGFRKICIFVAILTSFAGSLCAADCGGLLAARPADLLVSVGDSGKVYFATAVYRGRPMGELQLYRESVPYISLSRFTEIPVGKRPLLALLLTYVAFEIRSKNSTVELSREAYSEIQSLGFDLKVTLSAQSFVLTREDFARVVRLNPYLQQLVIFPAKLTGDLRQLEISPDFDPARALLTLGLNPDLLRILTTYDGDCIGVDLIYDGSWLGHISFHQSTNKKRWGISSTLHSDSLQGYGLGKLLYLFGGMVFYRLSSGEIVSHGGRSDRASGVWRWLKRERLAISRDRNFTFDPQALATLYKTWDFIKDHTQYSAGRFSNSSVGL